jgi:hypothetical protein
MPIVPQVPDFYLDPPDRPLEAQCPCCNRWVPEVGWDVCSDCHREVCPVCLTQDLEPTCQACAVEKAMEEE